MSEVFPLKRLSEDQAKAASEVAARAFQDDPYLAYYFPNPIERKIKSAILCEYTILRVILSGEVFITSSDIEGVAVWHAYEIKDQKIGKQSKEIIRRIRKVRREVFSDSLFLERYGIITEKWDLLRNKHANFPLWELDIIAVDPIHQGKGYGSKLLRMKLSELDKLNSPCYLSTLNERNIEFFEHFGFEIVDKVVIPNSELKLRAMIRKKKK